MLLTKAFLKELYDKISKHGMLGPDLPLPVLQQYNLDSYILIQREEYSVFHTINEGWDNYAQEVFDCIKESGFHIIDDVLPTKTHRALKSIIQSVYLEPDMEKLLKNSSAYNERYYNNWKLRETYKIFIYSGSILPQIVIYDSIFKLEIFHGTIVSNENAFFIALEDAVALPFILKEELPKSVYNDLHNCYAEYQINKIKGENSPIYSEEESKALNRLFGNEIPRSFHKDLNLASLIKGLIYLSNNGYDVTEAEEKIKNTHKYSHLYPVYKEGVEKEVANALKIKCRSAKSGLLYLRASSWQELENSNTYLYILTGDDNTDCRFCTNREDVIRDSKADYRVLRIEAGDGVSDIDDIIEGKFDPENLWLILRMSDKKEYKSIFEEIRNSESSDTIWNVNIGNESDD
jgi:hypothetical protein